MTTGSRTLSLVVAYLVRDAYVRRNSCSLGSKLRAARLELLRALHLQLIAKVLRNYKWHNTAARIQETGDRREYAVDSRHIEMLHIHRRVLSTFRCVHVKYLPVIVPIGRSSVLSNVFILCSDLNILRIRIFRHFDRWLTAKDQGPLPQGYYLCDALNLFLIISVSRAAH